MLCSPYLCPEKFWFTYKESYWILLLESLLYPARGLLPDSSWGLSHPWWLYLGSTSYQVLPWWTVCSDAIAKQVTRDPGVRGLPSEMGLQQSSSIIFQPIREHLFSVQTFPGMGSSLHQPILNLDGFQKEQLWRPITEAWSATSTDFPFHPEEAGLWAWKRILRHHHLLLHQLPGRTAEVRTEADSGSSVLAASNHCLSL